jgi:hypothetical protein
MATVDQQQDTQPSQTWRPTFDVTDEAALYEALNLFGIDQPDPKSDALNAQLKQTLRPFGIDMDRHNEVEGIVNAMLAREQEKGFLIGLRVAGMAIPGVTPPPPPASDEQVTDEVTDVVARDVDGSIEDLGDVMENLCQWFGSVPNVRDVQFTLEAVAAARRALRLASSAQRKRRAQ